MLFSDNEIGSPIPAMIDRARVRRIGDNTLARPDEKGIDPTGPGPVDTATLPVPNISVDVFDYQTSRVDFRYVFQFAALRIDEGSNNTDGVSARVFPWREVCRLGMSVAYDRYVYTWLSPHIGSGVGDRRHDDTKGLGRF